MNSLWFPYSQMKTANRPIEISSAQGLTLTLKDGRYLTDGISSWWSAIYGYNHPVLNQALIDQSRQMAHVMLGGLTHEPAQLLADKLVEITPGPLRHVFFSDSGSVAVEVALKMALQYHSNQGNKDRTKFIALNNAYHGDTFLAMSMGEDSDFQTAFDHVLQVPYRVRPAYDLAELDQSITQLKDVLEGHGTDIAAMIVEPLMQGAGGFRMYEPAYLTAAIELCHQYDVLMIFDEVATGFGRTGQRFAADCIEASPDIMVLGKALTGGYMGHAATLATDNVFGEFWDDDPEKAFMHGPTFMGNPLACAIGLAGIELFQNENYLQKVHHVADHFTTQLTGLSGEFIQDVRIQGGIAAIEVKSAQLLTDFGAFAVNNGVWLRSFGPYLYSAPAYVATDQELTQLSDVMVEFCLQLHK